MKRKELIDFLKFHYRDNPIYLNRETYNKDADAYFESINEHHEESRSVSKNLDKEEFCPNCGMTPPIIGSLDHKYMACDACGTKWAK